MKRLAIVTASDFPCGSASAQLLRLMGAGLVRGGWTVRLLLQRGRFAESGEEAGPRCGEEAGVRYRHCGFRTRPRHPALRLLDSFLGTVVAVAILAADGLRKRIDVALVYNRSGIESFFVAACCRLFRIRVVAYLSEWQEESEVTRGRWYRLPVWWDFLFRMKGVSRLYHGLVVPSHYLYDYGRKQLRFPEGKLYVLPSLVDLSFFEGGEGDRSRPKEMVRIGYCGIPTRKDGGEDLLRAFQLVQQTFPATELLVVGGRARDAGLVEGLKRLAGELGVAGNVRFTGRVPFQRVPALLRSCDILVLARPSGTFAEAGFPTKLGEYMACRKPVVVTRVGDMRRYLRHGIEAMLAEPDCPQDVAAQICWLIRHPEEAVAVGHRGYQWAAETLSYERACEPYGAFLARV